VEEQKSQFFSKTSFLKVPKDNTTMVIIGTEDGFLHIKDTQTLRKNIFKNSMHSINGCRSEKIQNVSIHFGKHCLICVVQESLTTVFSLARKSDGTGFEETPEKKNILKLSYGSPLKYQDNRQVFDLHTTNGSFIGLHI
jgi:hypothetical protein